ncbi:MAG TPA: TRAP transporter TatT component family protein [Candidatus Acidoferrum sp.]|nr:TRAP transporter TatT component family protein [Candidatus Acidoferrum sp.]
MNTIALAEDKEWGTLSGTATRCISCVEVSLRLLFPAEVELLAAGLRYTLLQATLFCLRRYFQLRKTLRQVPRLFADCGLYEISSMMMLLATAMLMTGCSVRKFAINKLGDSLANSGTTFASDNDPEFVGQAIPFSLKLIEGLLAESPRHRGLLFAAASGFTQYSYAYVQQSSEQVEIEDLTKSTALAERARNLYLRARDYGLRGLETKHRGFTGSLRENPRAAVLVAKAGDVPLLYWTAVAWGAAISLSKDRPELVAEQPQVEAMIDRAYELNPDYEYGAIDQFLISYESARQGAKGDFAARCKAHFDRAVSLSNAQLASPYVAYAETVSLQKQNREEFETLLKQALAVVPDKRPEWRLSNIMMQRRARWLLSREDELFLDAGTTGASK